MSIYKKKNFILIYFIFICCGEVEITKKEVEDKDFYEEIFDECKTGFDCVSKQCNIAVCKNGKCEYKPSEEGEKCDDSDPCTENDKCKDGKCIGENICVCEKTEDCQNLEDNNLCNGVLICENKKCVVDEKTIVICDTGKDTECVKNKCNEKTGKCEMKNEEDGLQCDDHDKCTLNDKCKSGECIGSENICECKEDKDCEEIEFSPCEGKGYYCDKKTYPYKCVLLKEGAIVCDSTNDTFCLKNTCIAEKKSCEMKPVNEGFFCDDNDPCTLSDKCINGECKGKEKICDDKNKCTNDFCKDGDCVFEEIKIDCNDNNPCTDDKCNPMDGKCINEKINDVLCDDNDPCTISDKCINGECKGEEKICDDKNKCTNDFCKDGDCVFEEIKIDCNDNNPCTDDKCNPVDGKCINEKIDNVLCDDNDPCTIFDKCINGECKGNKKDCDDKNECTNDFCDSNGNCVNPPATGKSCDDKNPCTENDKCSKDGKCVGTAKNCNDNNPCTDDFCDAGNCKNILKANCCGNGVVEKGEECDFGYGVNSSLCKNCKWQLFEVGFGEHPDVAYSENLEKILVAWHETTYSSNGKIKGLFMNKFGEKIKEVVFVENSGKTQGVNVKVSPKSKNFYLAWEDFKTIYLLKIDENGVIKYINSQCKVPDPKFSIIDINMVVNGSFIAIAYDYYLDGSTDARICFFKEDTQGYLDYIVYKNFISSSFGHIRSPSITTTFNEFIIIAWGQNIQSSIPNLILNKFSKDDKLDFKSDNILLKNGLEGLTPRFSYIIDFDQSPPAIVTLYSRTETTPQKKFNSYVYGDIKKLSDISEIKSNLIHYISGSSDVLYWPKIAYFPFWGLGYLYGECEPVLVGGWPCIFRARKLSPSTLNFESSIISVTSEKKYTYPSLVKFSEKGLFLSSFFSVSPPTNVYLKVVDLRY